jgi:putative ABC transport system permease protein
MHARLLSWSLRHRRWRHLLNAITMAVTVSVVMLFVSVMVELVAFVQISGERELTRILVFPKIISPGAGVDGLPLTLKANLEKLDGVKVVQRVKTFGGRHPTSGNTYIIVGEEHSGVELNTDFFPVAPDVQEAWKKERLGAIVTTATARDLGLEVGETAEIPSSLGKLKIKVVGLSYGALVGHRIAIHFDYAQEYAKQVDSCGYRVFTAPADFARVAREINDTTRNSPMPAQAVSDAHFAASWARKAGLVPALLGFLGMFLVFTTALTLANNSAISIRERRTETATMRVLGYKRSTIIRMLLVEAVLVGVIGGLLAVAVMSLVFSGGVQLTPGSSKLLQAVEIGVPGIICGLIASVVIPLAGALPSALATVRTPLVVALRDSA